MTIKVRHKTDKEIAPVIYENVEEIIDAVNEDGAVCKQICMKDGSTATYSVTEWVIWKRTWTRIRA